MESNLEKNKIFEMNLHDEIELFNNATEENVFQGDYCIIRRVPGGWIYIDGCSGNPTVTTTFVPYDTEFKFKS